LVKAKNTSIINLNALPNIVYGCVATIVNKRYWGRYFWAIGYGAWSTGNITDEKVQEYLEHHRDPSNAGTGIVILEQ